jgi:hypothetical protein
MFIFALLAVIALLIWLATIEDKIDRVSRLEADNACYDLDLKINELKGRYRWLKSNMVESKLVDPNYSSFYRSSEH